VFQCVFEYFHLLHQRQMIVVGRHLNDIQLSRDTTVQRVNGNNRTHPKHDAVFNIEQNLLFVAIVTDQRV
jgi:hypothetical protein